MREAKRLLKALLGREPWIRRDVALPRERHGSDYGGWSVWPDGLDAASTVYSLGVGEDVSFDLSLIERFGLTVHAFDPTPRSAAWVAAQRLPARLRFHPVGVYDRDGSIELFPPADPAHVSHSVVALGGGGAPIQVPVKRLSTILRELGHDRIDLLKIDIEGAEYAVLSDLLASGVAVRQLLVELHHRFPSIGVGRSRRAVAELRRAGFLVFDVSPYGEVSLVQRTALQGADSA